MSPHRIVCSTSLIVIRSPCSQHSRLLHQRGSGTHCSARPGSTETDWVKLEVIADEITLLPIRSSCSIAAERLVADGFRRPPLTQ
jgi:hypothetical protein